MPRKPPAPGEIFISHSSRDAAFVERLVGMLHGYGLRTFFSQRHIRGAQQWHDEIGAVLARCSWFVVILTPHSDTSYRSRIVPLLYKTWDFKKLSWTLSSLEYVDFRKDFDRGCHDLLAVWKLKYKGA